MPEGHTIHRLALDLARDFQGEKLVVSSPQGRFDGVAALQGRRLTRVHAIGKHLFLELGRARLHVHLGLFGKFRKRRVADEPPRSSVRLRLSTGARGSTWDLTGPTACELLEPEAFEALRARLGVDPLAEGARPATAWKRVRASKRAIGALLLDQSVFAGIGNVYRAELLFLAGVHPETRGVDLPRAKFDVLWREAKRLLRDGVKANRIITVPAAERRSRQRREQLYVYKRASCRRCEAEIGRITVAARAMYYCPKCQAYPALATPPPVASSNRS